MTGIPTATVTATQSEAKKRAAQRIVYSSASEYDRYVVALSCTGETQGVLHVIDEVATLPITND